MVSWLLRFLGRGHGSSAKGKASPRRPRTVVCSREGGGAGEDGLRPGGVTRGRSGFALQGAQGPGLLRSWEPREYGCVITPPTPTPPPPRQPGAFLWLGREMATSVRLSIRPRFCRVKPGILVPCLRVACSESPAFPSQKTLVDAFYPLTQPSQNPLADLKHFAWSFKP